MFIVSFVLDVAKQRVLSSLTVPVVGINTPSTDGFDASVRIDDIAAMRGVVRLLRSFGHESVAYVEQPMHLPLSYAATRCAWKVSSEQLTIRGTTTGMCW